MLQPWGQAFIIHVSVSEMWSHFCNSSANVRLGHWGCQDHQNLRWKTNILLDRILSGITNRLYEAAARCLFTFDFRVKVNPSQNWSNCWHDKQFTDEDIKQTLALILTPYLLSRVLRNITCWKQKSFRQRKKNPPSFDLWQSFYAYI